jgi:carbamoylphosphate synthase small subunit
MSLNSPVFHQNLVGLLRITTRCLVKRAIKAKGAIKAMSAIKTKSVIKDKSAIKG